MLFNRWGFDKKWLDWLSYVLKYAKKTGGIIFCGLLLTSAPAASYADKKDELIVKIALVYKISKFVEWSESDLEQPFFNICVLGDDDVLKGFDILKKRKIKDRAIRIIYFDETHVDAEECRIVYVSAEKAAASFPDERILTISDSKNFSHNYGMIEFALKDERMEIKINLKNAKQRGIKILAPLLQVSTIVSK